MTGSDCYQCGATDIWPYQITTDSDGRAIAWFSCPDCDNSWTETQA